MTQRKINLFLSALFLLAGSIVPAFAQYCPSSQLNYIVRDAKGKIIDPAKLDAPDFIEESVMAIDYAEAEKKREGYWAVGEAVKKAREQKAGNLDKETDKLFTLHKYSGGCNFTEPITFKLTLGKKTMNLVFRFAAHKNNSGEVFLVDSLPFAQGTFEIDLPEKSDYYAPANWRKTSDAAEKPAPVAAHHIRGRIINAVTKKPIENAVVMFRTIPIYYGEHDDQNKSKAKTDVKGRFAFENLRGDYFKNITKAAVFVEHTDFAVGTYTYLFEKGEDNNKKKILVSGKNAKLESRDDLTIELTPLVIVSGRVVDAATGANLPDAENLPKNFTVATEYGEGGYLNGSLSIPCGKVDVRPQLDGTFTFKTAPGKNVFRASGELSKQKYYLVGYSKEIQVGETGLKDLILKIERDPSEVKKEFDALIKQADEHFAAGRYDAALKLFQEAARLKPDDTRAHYGVIQTFTALKRLDEAVSIYRQTVAAKPDNAISQYALGLSLDRAGKVEEAVKHYKEAVRLAPAVALHRYNLGNTLGTLGQTEAAIAELKEAIRLEPKYVDAHTILGMEYHTLGRYEESITHLSDALRLDPTNEYALPSRSPTYLVLNRGAEAAADAEKFIAAHGWKHEQSIYMALFGSLGYRLVGKETEAQKLLETAAKNTDTSRWVAPAVEYFLGAMSADDLLKLAIDNDKMTEARAYIGMNLLLLGKREEALPHLRWVVENGNKTFHEYHFVKATLERAVKQ